MPAAYAADTAVPELVSFSVSPKTVTPGQQINANYSVTDDSGTITTLAFGFTDNVGNVRWLQLDNNAGIALNGAITKTVPNDWTNGAYRLTYVSVYDAAGNYVTYMRDGTAYKQPSGAAGPTSHTFNFSTGDFDVATSAPAAPLNVSATRGDQQATIHWTPPATDGSPISSFTVTSSAGGITKTVAGDQTTATVTGLTNGTAYTFTVTATNAIGTSPASTPSNSVTPAAVPAAPTAVSATRGDQSAQVSWTTPAANGSPITGHTITSTPGGITKTVTGDATTATVTGLTNGTAYTFTVTATNANGDGLLSDASNSVVPAGAPAQIAKPTATVKGRKAIVRWKPADSNGSPITGYIITTNKGHKKTVGPDARKVVFKRLKPGRYKFKVTATNDIGTAPSSPTTRIRIR